MIRQAFDNRPQIKESHWFFYVVMPLCALIWLWDGPYQRMRDAQDAAVADWVSAPPDGPIAAVADWVNP